MKYLFQCCLHVFILALLFGFAASPPLLAAPDKEQIVSVYHKEVNKQGYKVLADNNLPVPVFIQLNFKTLQNYEADRHLPVAVVLPALAKQVELINLKAVKGKKHLFESSYKYSIGNPLNTKPDIGYHYLFPFEHGRKFRVDQGFNGKSTHFGQNQYAVDFDMPEGTPVYAARGGVIAEIKQDSNRNSRKPGYNNYLLVYHSDGTIGNYAHLQQNGVKVQVGDHVKAGDLLAHSGNTGFSSGPHLHFDVRIPLKTGSRQSIPINFLNFDRTPIVPEAGQYYYAFHPGRGDFDVELGRLLHNEDFLLWSAAVSPVAGKAEFRIKTVDDTKIVFIRNPLPSAIDAEARFALKNMQSSKGRVVKLRVPAQTELFMTLLNPNDPLKPAEFTSSLTYSYKH